MSTDDFASTIEELKREVTTLRQQNDEYRRLASFPQLNPNPVLEFDRTGQVVFTNPAALQTLTQLGLTDAHLFLPDDFMEISTSSGEKADMQFFRVVEFVEKIFEETIYFTPEYDTLRIYAIDVSQRRHFENALKQSEEKYHTLYETMAQGVVYYDASMQIISANPTAERILGVTFDQMQGRSNVDPFWRVVREDGSDFPSDLRPSSISFQTGIPVNNVTMGIFNSQLNDFVWVLVNAVPLFIPGNEKPYQVYSTFEDITERKKIEEALRESEARFRMALKNAPVSVAAQDKELHFIWAYNQRTVNPLELIGKTDTDIFPPEVAAWTMGLKLQVLETGKELREQGWVTSGGQRLFLDLFLEPIRDYDGQITGVGIATVDLTTQKLAEQSLRESEERYHSLFEKMTEGFAIHEMIYDENGKPSDYRFLDINPAFERLTGLKRENVIGKTFHEVLPDEGDNWVSTYEKVVLTGESVEFENYSPTLNKYYEVFAYRCAPSQFAVIFLDITERKQMEDDLRINLTKYSVLFDTLPLGVTVTDQNGQIVESNQEATRLLGLSEEEQKRRLIQDEQWKIVRPDKSPMPPEEYASVRALKEQRLVENIEMGISKADDQITWISVTAVPLPLKDYGIVITYNDITRRMLAEEALHKAHDKLEMTVQQRTQELLNANIELKAEIEERKRVESQLVIQTRALEAQRQRFNDVLEILPVYTILLTPDYHVAFANRYFRERFGEDNGRCCYEYLFGLSAPCENCDTYKVLQTGTNHRWEWTGPDSRNYDVFDFPFNDVDGSSLILELGIDITERKQAERQLILLTTALETAANGIILVDTNGVILWSNSAFSQMTGYTKQEIVGQNPRFLKSGKQDPEFYRNLWETILAGTVWRGEMINRKKNGTFYTEEQTITPVFDKSGNINFISIKQDITEHKQAEDALIKSEEKYRSLVIATAQIVWQTNVDGEVVEDNPNWRAYTGQTKGEFLGRGWINALHPADQPRTAEIWARAVESKTPYDTEYRIRSHTGEYGYFAVRGVPITDIDSNISGWIGTCTDITEKKQYENQLIQTEKHAAIGRMVGSVTHEINNPLQTIKNCLYLIQQDTESDSLNAEPLEMALSETQRLSNIVGQLRQLYRPQAVQTMRSQDFLEIIEEVHSLINPHLNNSQVVWQTSTGLKSCYINCVRDQMIEVLLNICMNGIEAMQPTGGILSVNMIRASDKHQVGIVISDSGLGIKPEILPHIFEPFITTKEYGLGLGLSISYGIIQKHGGQIMVDSQPGQGTKFTIWLPIFAGTDERGE